MIEPGKHKLTEALGGTTPAGTTPNDPTSEPTGPGSSPREIAEETRRQQEARPQSREDREDRLVNVGRGQQTHG
jgi:hypothetical protein